MKEVELELVFEHRVICGQSGRVDVDSIRGMALLVINNEFS